MSHFQMAGFVYEIALVPTSDCNFRDSFVQINVCKSSFFSIIINQMKLISEPEKSYIVTITCLTTKNHV